MNKKGPPIYYFSGGETVFRHKRAFKSALKEVCRGGGYIFQKVSREEVESGSHRYILAVVDALEKMGRIAQGRMVIAFEGYDDVPDEVYEIPEIRAWVAGLVQKKPHFFYFLAFEHQNLQTLIACVSDVKTFGPVDRKAPGRCPTGTPLLLDITIPDELHRIVSPALAAYCRKIGDPGYLSRFNAAFSGQFSAAGDLL